MNKELWTFNETGTALEDNDANDFYYSWISIDVDGKNLKDLFYEYLAVGLSSVNIRVKARDGAIFIVREGDKDDTPNPK